MKKIVLSTERFANAPDVDYNIKVNIKSATKQIENDDKITNIDLGELFNLERNQSNKYRLLGKIDYMSMLNNLNSDYTNLDDFFLRYYRGERKTFLNSFKVYVLKKLDYIYLRDTVYKQRYEVVSLVDDIYIYPCAYSSNIFNEQVYLYSMNIDFDLTDQFDDLGKPITELYLYFDYQLDIAKSETKKVNIYKNGGLETISNNRVYEYNDIVVGDLVNIYENEVDTHLINSQEHVINMKYGENEIEFKYNPIQEIPLKHYNDNLNFANKNVVNNFIDIPDYAKEVDKNGNVIWKEILPHGFIDELSGRGVNHPFINGTHYVYTNHTLTVTPNMFHIPTKNVFDLINLQGYRTELFILNNSKDNFNSKC